MLSNIKKSKPHYYTDSSMAVVLGKNDKTEILRSFSRRTDSEKLWIGKPYYNRILCTYRIEEITTEIFVAWLYTLSVGKEKAPKAKFDPRHRGMVSRIIGDNINEVKSLSHAFLYHEPIRAIPQAAQQSFLDALIFAIIVGNRDISFNNFIYKSSQDTNKEIIYPIDGELALRTADEFNYIRNADKLKHDITPQMPLIDLLNIIYKNPQNIAKIFLDNKFTWNITKHHPHNQATRDKITKLLFGFITKEAYIMALKKITDHIEADNFVICTKAKNKMLDQLDGHPHVYPQTLIDNTITPRIDEATTLLKENIACIKRFLAQKAYVQNQSGRSNARYDSCTLM